MAIPYTISKDVAAHGSDWAHFDLGDARLLEIMRRGDRPQIDQTRYQVGYAASVRRLPVLTDRTFRSGLVFEKNGGVGFEPHGDLTATMLFK